MRRAIVHIGHPKTASTFLQHLMLLNRSALAEVGFWAPAGHPALALPFDRAADVAEAVSGGDGEGGCGEELIRPQRGRRLDTLTAVATVRRSHL